MKRWSKLASQVRHESGAQYKVFASQIAVFELKALPMTGASPPDIHPNVSSPGPPTSGAVKVDSVKFSFDFFTENLRLNQVRSATASSYFDSALRRHYFWQIHYQIQNHLGLVKGPDK